MHDPTIPCEIAIASTADHMKHLGHGATRINAHIFLRLKWQSHHVLVH